ncbi:MAG: hypothetical protein KIT87_17535 [Anaerolineae bacterium]|nr:hypothetical protein [Anaerolineae bacterium]
MYGDNDAATQARSSCPPSRRPTSRCRSRRSPPRPAAPATSSTASARPRTSSYRRPLDRRRHRSRTPLTYYGLAQFNLGAAGSRIEFDEATLTLTGLDASLLDPRLDSHWLVDLLGSSVDANLGRATFNMIANAPVDATLSPHLMDTDLGKDRPNSLSLSKAAKDALSAHVRTSGSVTFRTWAEPQYSQGMHLFAWDGRTGGTAKAPSISALTITYLP